MLGQAITSLEDKETEPENTKQFMDMQTDLVHGIC